MKRQRSTRYIYIHTHTRACNLDHPSPSAQDVKREGGELNINKEAIILECISALLKRTNALSHTQYYTYTYTERGKLFGYFGQWGEREREGEREKAR